MSGPAAPTAVVSTNGSAKTRPRRYISTTTTQQLGLFDLPEFSKRRRNPFLRRPPTTGCKPVNFQEECFLRSGETAQNAERCCLRPRNKHPAKNERTFETHQFCWLCCSFLDLEEFRVDKQNVFPPGVVSLSCGSKRHVLLRPCSYNKYNDSRRRCCMYYCVSNEISCAAPIAPPPIDPPFAHPGPFPAWLG